MRKLYSVRVQNDGVEVTWKEAFMTHI